MLSEGISTIAIYDALVFNNDGEHIACVLYEGQAGFLTKNLEFVSSNCLDPQLINRQSGEVEEFEEINEFNDTPLEIPVYSPGQQALKDRFSNQIRKQIQNKKTDSNNEDTSFLYP